MTKLISAIYEGNGLLRLTEEVEGLQKNQQVTVTIIFSEAPEEEFASAGNEWWDESCLSPSELTHLRSLTEEEIQAVVAETLHSDLKSLTREKLLAMINRYEHYLASDDRGPDFLSTEADLMAFGLDEQNRRPLTEEELQRRLEAAERTQGLIAIDDPEIASQIAEDPNLSLINLGVWLDESE